MATHDSDFAAFAGQVEKESVEKAKRATGGGFTFEKIEWTGLEPNVPKIIRAVGGVPDSREDKGTAITRRIAWIVGDDGKKFRCIFPERSQDEDHLMWRMIAAVNEVTYVNKKKTNIHEERHPEIYRMVNKNGLLPGDKKSMFDSGWVGKQKLLMNVIARDSMDFHKEHKHTMLLSKSVNVVGDRVYADEGVPAYGFVNLLATGLFKFYKDWRKYDIAITRTGIKETPYRIINASKYIDEVPEELQPIISDETWLTKEEQSWEVYDLEKLFKYTTYTKIYNKLKLSIRKIDALLGTRFDQMFIDAVEKEADERAESDNSNEDENSSDEKVETVETKNTEAPKAERTRERAAPPETDNDFSSKLAGWDLLTSEERAKITGVNPDGSIEYSTDEEILKCPKCGTGSPESFSHCPSCGKEF